MAAWSFPHFLLQSSPVLWQPETEAPPSDQGGTCEPDCPAERPSLTEYEVGLEELVLPDLMDVCIALVLLKANLCEQLYCGSALADRIHDAKNTAEDIILVNESKHYDGGSSKRHQEFHSPVDGDLYGHVVINQHISTS